MVIYNGYCRPLKNKVDFEVKEVNPIETSRGVKWQIKGEYKTYKISVFAKKEVALEIKEKLENVEEDSVSFDAEEVIIYDSEELSPFPFFSEDAFAAEEVVIYDSEELSPFPFFSPTAFLAEEDEEETENPQWKTLRTIRDFEASLLWFFDPPLHEDNEEQSADTSFPLVIYDWNSDPEYCPITDITYSDEFDIIYLIGELLEEGSEWEEVVNKSITIKQAYDKLKNILRTIAPEEVRGFKVKYGGKVYDPHLFEPQARWEDDDEFGLLIYPPDEEEDDELNPCHQVTMRHIDKHIEEGNQIERVAFLVAPVEECDEIEELFNEIHPTDSKGDWEFITDFRYVTNTDEETGGFIVTMSEGEETFEDITYFTFDELLEKIGGKETFGGNTFRFFGWSSSEDDTYDEDMYWDAPEFGSLYQQATNTLYFIVEKDVVHWWLEEMAPIKTYEEWAEHTVKQLKEICEERYLVKYGKKADIIARLMEYDEENMPVDYIDLDDVDEEDILTNKEVSQIAMDEVATGEGDEPFWIDTQFSDDEDQTGHTATILIDKENHESPVAITEIKLYMPYYCEDCGCDWEDCECDEEDEDYEAEELEEAVVDIEEEDGQVSISYEKEAETKPTFASESPFMTDIGFITYNSEEGSNQVGVDDKDVIPMIFDKHIPPEVWGSIKDSTQKEYIETKDESLLICPQCGMSKSELRANEGTCPTTDPMDESYVAKRSCPYGKHFAPMHWITDDNKNMTEATKTAMNNVYFDDKVPIKVLAAEDEIFNAPNINSDFDEPQTMLVSKADYYDSIHLLPNTITAAETIDGLNMKLGFFKSESGLIDSIYSDKLFSEEELSTPFSAESAPLPTLWAEDLTNFEAPSLTKINLSAEDYASENDAQIINKYDYYRSIMDLGDDDEVIDIGDSVAIIDKDILEPDLEIDINICVGCERRFTKAHELDKQGLCIDCSEESIVLSELQRYKGGGDAVYSERDELPEEEWEIDEDFEEVDEDEEGYDISEEEYEDEWLEEWQAQDENTTNLKRFDTQESNPYPINGWKTAGVIGLTIVIGLTAYSWFKNDIK